MPATATSLPSDSTLEPVDFLRRLSSMMTGGRNAEMLLEAASMIETLTRRAIAAEQLCAELQEDHVKSLEVREVAELASDNLIAETAALKAELAETRQRAETEVGSLKAQLEESRQRAERDRTTLVEEALRLQAIAQEAEVGLANANASLEELRNQAPTIDPSLALVPIQSLQTARDQFDFLAKGFAKNGDVISQTICEIGACALEKALAGNGPAAY